MANISTNTAQELLAKRDQKAIPHLKQYAPVWIVDEQIILEDEAIQFNVMFLHPHAGEDGKSLWVNRRYRYDGFNNTLYHKGQTAVDEDRAVDISNSEPYVNTTITDTPNAYGG